MRRQDRELKERSELDAILHEATVLHVAMWDGHEPYLVPLNFGYDGVSLFFHSAREGRKIEVWESFPRVCFQVETGVEIKTGGATACTWGCRYRSVIGYGRVERVQEEGALHALRAIMRKYAGRDDHTYGDNSLESVKVWRVVIERMTGKQSV